MTTRTNSERNAAPDSVLAQAHSVMLPIVDEAQLGEDTAAFLSGGGRCLLLGETREEYLQRSLSPQRRERESASWLRDYIAQAAAVAGRDLVIAVDQEIGGIQRLHHLIGPLPDVAKFHTMSDADIEEFGAALAGRVRALGVNLLLSPIVDTDDGSSAMLRGRVLSSDGSEVARVATAFVTGLQSAGVAATAKHFPGHRRAIEDPHTKIVDVSASREELADDIAPFRAVVDAGVKVVMMGPAAFTAIDPHESASLSETMVRLLREKLRFLGVVLTDDLDMASISRNRDLPEVALAAMSAGADLLLVPDPRTAIFLARQIAGSVESGTLDARRLRDASERVISLRRAATAR